MRLHEFISANIEAILKEWQDFARANQPPGGNMNEVELRDHAKELLTNIVRDMTSAQTEPEREAKSQGNAPTSGADTPAEEHADERLGAGFSIRLLVAEYRALRASVLRLWFDGAAPPHKKDADEVEDLIRFNEAIDKALAESVARYSEAVTENSDIFIGMLGHDLRSPLQVLSFGAAKLKNMEDAGNSLNQLGSTMIASVQRMKEMLDNLMDFTETRIGEGLSIRRSRTDLAAIIHQLIEEFRSAHSENTFKQVITGDCSGNWDAIRIGQICQNLISNALQHGAPMGEVVVSCEGLDDKVILTVKSDGEPILESLQQNIFHLAHRKHYAKENLNKNLGLGLYIVKELVTAHNGKVSVESTQSKGTTFKVELPKTAS
ncbi:sensor histidine kinase [Halopseudomonas pelagia]|uniref:histidine kinase n=1 Tax=Halopseudomonas pelagia TaxID=553151 RepID=A0AA91U0P3_9GAMM|nr:sensor histidine kinase [Halopseudomonas pelagia]PCC98347.1 two-component sensor histidine kinase [Halopseudomonas pelagia]QFY56640.1 sensor histidine kinase [Halopseudomonas pelagia]